TVNSHIGSLRRAGSALGFTSRTVLPIGCAVVIVAVPRAPVASSCAALPLIVGSAPLPTAPTNASVSPASRLPEAAKLHATPPVGLATPAWGGPGGIIEPAMPIVGAVLSTLGALGLVPIDDSVLGMIIPGAGGAS